MRNQADLEALFIKCKESLEDVVGWKVFIFLPQNLAWRFFILLTVVFTYVIRSVEFFFFWKWEEYYYLEYICSVFYFFDTLWATLHIFMSNTRKLRHGKKRHMFLLIIDYISLLPFQMIYNFSIYVETDILKMIMQSLRINVCLRVYQVFYFFAEARYWVYEMKLYFVTVVVEMTCGILLFNHSLACIYYYMLPQSNKLACMKIDLKNCIMENELLMYSFFSMNNMNPSFITPVEDTEVFTVCLFLVGFLLTFGIILPVFYFCILNLMKKYSELTARVRQLHLFLASWTDNKALREKTIKYFQTLWTYGKGNRPPEIFKLLPPCLQKNTFCDVYWNALTHSQFLSALSFGCKRSLSLQMKTDFILPNTTLLNLKEKKKNLLYLESGLIQIMAEENSTSPVLTFSAGTVLGELSLFYQLESKAVVRTAKLCVIHSLNYSSCLKVLLDFPKDMRKIYSVMKYRLKAAKAFYDRRNIIHTHFKKDQAQQSSLMQERNNIQWIKHQYRAIYDLRQTLLDEHKNKEEAHTIIQRQINDLNTQLEHTSIFMSMIALSNVVVSKYEAVCLSMRFPWSMNPQCSFLMVWRRCMLFLNLLVAASYPVFIGWYPNLPLWFFNISVFITFVYIIDVVILLFTAVEVNNVLITKMGAILSYRLARMSFYADIVAALPVQVFQYFSKNSEEKFALSLGLVNTLVKCYQIIAMVFKWNYLNSEQPFKRTIMKNMFFFAFLIFWVGTFYKLSGVECIFYKCGDDDWFKAFADGGRNAYLKEYASILIIAYLALDMPYKIFHSTVFYSILIHFVFFYIFNMFYCLCTSELLCSFVLGKTHVIGYKKLTNFVDNFMQHRKIGGLIPKRVSDTLWFQWFYDRGTYITQENRIVNDIPAKLNDELIKNTFFQTMQSCPLLKLEDEEFIMELCRKCERIVLPANSVLVTFGTQMMCLYLIHKGYVQGNSFLSKDIVSNVGKPVLLSKGDTFPIMNAFIQIPSIMSARTITDCELLVLNLEDVLSFMIVNDIFKDVVTSLKELDTKSLTSARPGLSIVENLENINLSSSKTNLEKKSYLEIILKIILLKSAINPRGKSFFRWEVFRVTCILIGLFCWPFFYGCLARQPSKYYLAYLLLILETTTWVDFYLRMRVAFENKKGIYVTHPSKTAFHYLTSSFILDVTAFFPYFQIIYGFQGDVKQYELGTISLHIILRSASWYRIIGLFNYMSDIKIFSYGINLVKYALVIIITLNTFTNLWIFMYFSNVGEVMPVLEKHSGLLELYFDYLMVTIQCIFGNKFAAETALEREIYYLMIFFLPSWMLEIIIYGSLMFRFLSKSLTLSTYRYYLKSFLKFLNDEKIEEKYVREAIDYYEHLWQKMKGINFKSIFSRFPDILHEDLLYSAYKSTLNKVSCFSKANEAFYRTLSRSVEEIYLKKGSRVTIAKQAISIIYFVHKGQCEVEKNSILLNKGSILGDIRAKGVMTHTITAKTHVTLLKIPTSVLLLTMDNFPITKAAFEREVSQFDDFVKSSYVKIMTEEMGDEIFLMKLATDNNLTDEEQDDAQAFQFKALEMNQKIRAMTKGVFNPESFKSRLLRNIFVLDAFLTSFIIPIIVAMRSEPNIMLVIIYILDWIWILKIVVTTKTAILDPKTGILIYNKKIIFRKYYRRKTGFWLDLLTVLPIEIFFLILKKIYKYNDRCFGHFYFLRILRFFHFLNFIVEEEKKKLSLNFPLKCSIIVGKLFLTINFFASLILLLGLSRVNLKHCYPELNYEQWQAIQDSYLCATDYYCGTGMDLCVPKNFIELFLTFITTLWGFYSRVSLLVDAVNFIFIQKNAKFFHICQLEELEDYLVVRNISPALLKRVKTYVIDLIGYCNEGAMPSLLTSAPEFIKYDIMGDLYMHHLANCFVFSGIDETFLMQLSTRLKRHVFFPGNYIAEKGDVDHSIYFVQKGEIYCLEKDENYPTLERSTDMFGKDEYFGILQGLFAGYPHFNTYRAKTLSEVLVLHFDDWRDMRSAYPDLVRTIFERALKGEKKTRFPQQ